MAVVATVGVLISAAVALLSVAFIAHEAGGLDRCRNRLGVSR